MSFYNWLYKGSPETLEIRSKNQIYVVYSSWVTYGSQVGQSFVRWLQKRCIWLSSGTVHFLEDCYPTGMNATFTIVQLKGLQYLIRQVVRCDCFLTPCQAADSALQPPEVRQQGHEFVYLGDEERRKEARSRVNCCVNERGGLG